MAHRRIRGLGLRVEGGVPHAVEKSFARWV